MKVNKITEKILDLMSDKIDDIISKGLKREARIEIATSKDGTATCEIEGRRDGVIIALAALENNILKEFNVPTELFDLIKMSVGTKDNDE